MTLSQKRKLLAATALPALATVMLLGFQNCSPGVVQSAKLASTGTTTGATGNLDEDTKPVTVAYSENTLVSMQLQTGLQSLSTRTINANTTAKAKISETGKADTVNAPMWMSVTNLAGEVCLDLIGEERPKAATARRFFNRIDFARAPASWTAEEKSDAIRRLARNFWGRNETAAERTLLLSNLDSAIAEARRTGVNDTTESEDIALYSCTAMLSSLDSIRF